MKSLRHLAPLVLVSSLFAVEPVSIRSVSSGTHERSGLRVVAGTVKLPTAVDWYIEEPLPPQLGTAYLRIPPSAQIHESGERARQIQTDLQLEPNRQAMRQIYHHARRFALDRDGIGPARVTDFPAKDVKFLTTHGRLDTFHLVPEVKLFIDVEERTAARPSLLAFELKPAVPDGKHWVLMSNAHMERRKIDPRLFETHNVALVPAPAVEDKEDPLMNTELYAALREGEPGTVEISLRRWGTDTRLRATWDLSAETKTDPAVVTQWAKLRMWNLAGFDDRAGGALLLDHWRSTLARNHKVQVPRTRWTNARRARLTQTMNVLGGRAAVRETLQLENIRAGEPSSSTPRLHAIETIPGIEIEPHPFEEMLAGRPGGQLTLADFTPADRFFVWFGAPRDIFSFLGKGAPVLHHTGLNVTGRHLGYGLEQKYLERFGMDADQLRALLESGAFKDLAIVLPDLFLIDGTEVSCLARLSNPLLAKGALKLLGVNLEGGKPVEIKRPGQGAVIWQMLADDVLLVSTHAREARHIASCAGTPQSLGASAEMRYMLEQLPPDDETLIFAYFSDPFIRRLVGPEVKIGQHRRMRARAELEGLTASALLHQVDTGRPPEGREDLVRKGYVTLPRQAADANLERNLVSYSPTYGTPARLATLADLDVSRVTDDEKAAYKNYRENYNQYWRRFFDPIGIRVRREGEGAYSAETFILPLLEHSLYRRFRDTVRRTDPDEALAVPALDPAPVGLASVNLAEKFWVEFLGDWFRAFDNKVGWSTQVFDEFGPDVHIALADADPIIALGGGEIGGLFGMVDGGRETLWISGFVSMLTRPTSILVGLRDPDAVRAELRRLPSRTALDGGFLGMGGTLYRVAGTERYVFEVDIERMFRLRFGVEVEGRYLHISNQPLTHRPKIVGTTTAVMNGAQIQLSPAACMRQLPALHASAMSRQREAAMSGIDYLYPLMTLETDTSTAIARHRELFGFAPVHPAPGHWEWADGQLRSTRFGTLAQQTQPELMEGESFGALQAVRDMKVGARFEQDGLRTRVEWRTAPE